MSNKNKLLTVFSDAEQEALYGLPDVSIHQDGVDGISSAGMG